MKAFRVLVVDDSPFMRKLVGDLIAKDSSFEVAATAADGADAVRQVRELRPDIVIMDLEMPAMNGLEALRLVMAECPTPVIMMSAVTDRGTRDTIRALQYGAFDFVRKPDGALKLDVSQMGEMLIDKLHIVRELVTSGELRLRRMADEGSEAVAGQMAAPHVLPPGTPAAEADSLPMAESALAEAAAEAAAAAPMAELPPQKPHGFGEGASGGSLPPSGASSTARLKNALPETNGKPGGGKAAVGRLPAQKGQQAPSQPRERTKRAEPPVEPGGVEKKTRLSAPQKTAVSVSGIPAAGRQPASPPSQQQARTKRTFTDIVAIGTSTGGPRALHEVLSAIPASFPAPILIVQHMPPKFTQSLAQRLDSCSALEVKEAEDGDPVFAGQAYLAPGGKHMRLLKDSAGGYRISLSEEDPVSGHRPSVDVMFGSLVGRGELRRHVVLMTGMGSDGAKAMKALREDGAVTLIAEAEETCVVYGMPRSAMENGAAMSAVPLQRIAPELVRSVEKQQARQL